MAIHLLADDNVYRRGNGPNVDLNRDFAVHRAVEPVWADILPARYATSPSSLSQPESRARDALLSRESYTRAASLPEERAYNMCVAAAGTADFCRAQ